MDSLRDNQLLDFWLLIYRRRWVVFLAVAVVGLVALIGSFLVTPLYRATVTLQIQRQDPDVLNMRDLSRVDYSWAAYKDFYQTQYKIIASREVARRAVETLGLASHPDFAPGSSSSPGLVARLKRLIPRKVTEREREPEDVAAGRILGSLEVTPIRNSQLVRISWVSEDPELAAKIADAVAGAYISSTIQSRYSTTDQARQFLVDQIGTLKKEISAIEARLQVYGELKGIVSIDDSHNLTLQALQSIADERTRSQTRLARAEARYRAMTETPPDGLKEVLTSTLIGRLRAEYAAYEAQLSEKSKRYKDGWPELQTLESKLTASRERLGMEIDRIAEQVLATARSEYTDARNTFNNLNNLLQDHQNDAQRLKRDAVEYTNLQSEVEKKRETLSALLQRKNEMTLSTRLKDLDATSSNIRIVEPARAPTAPFRPRTKANLLLGLVFGLVLGVGMVFLLDYLDNTFATVAELERFAATPVLAAIPRHGASTITLTRRARKRQTPNGAPFDLIASTDGGAGATEAYRDLRTAILLSHAGRPPRLLMITSSVASEGKTASALNLAVVLSHLGRRILLVDTDLRRPRLHSALSLPNKRGVSTYLTGMDEDPFGLIVPTGIELLDLMPSGPIPPNPSELLNSEIFAGMGQKMLDSGYDHVLFDSPPMLAVSDPVMIADVVDMALVVVRDGSTPRQSVRVALDKLKPARNGLTGLLLNGVNWDGPDYYRYHYGRQYGAPQAASERNAKRGAGRAAQS